MAAGTKLTASVDGETLEFDGAIESPRPFSFTVSVRSGVQEELEGLEAHGDGVSFRSPQPLLGGKTIQMVIGNAILVDAVIVGCVPMPGDAGDFWVRARFQGTSPTMNRLICEELNQMTDSIG